jgi:peptide/nickel transport system substrate-binding protein
VTAPGRALPSARVVAGFAALAVVAAGALAGCTSDDVVDPDRAGTVVVAVDSPLVSLNAGTADGRRWGSTFVLGLVSDGFVGLDATGAAVLDTSFGTVEKVSDAPLTVRYTIDPRATWSDGVPVTPADLLLEWAARSGQFDEAVPEGVLPDDEGEAAATPAPTTTAGTTPTSAPTPDATPTPTPTGTAAADEPAVMFGGTSPVLLHASAVPTIDGASLTLVYDEPVADWQVALDVGLPAHVVGEVALSDEAAPTPDASSLAATPSSATPSSSAPAPTPAPTAGATETAEPGSAQAWSDAVTAAITGHDRTALVAIADAWRTGWSAGELSHDPSRAVTTGPYVLTSVDPAGHAELARNEHYAGSRPAAYDRIEVRWSLDPLAQVDALRDGDVDVATPLDTSDVRAALDEVTEATVEHGGGPVLSLVVNPTGGGIVDPATYAQGDDDGTATAAAARAAVVAAVPREAMAQAAGLEPSDAVLAVAGPQAQDATPATTAPTGAPTDSASGEPTDASTPATTAAEEPAIGEVHGEVRVLVTTADPVRAAMFDALKAGIGQGFTVVEADVTDPATAYWDEPDAWDVALVPVQQSPLPAQASATWLVAGTDAGDDALTAARAAVASQLDPTALPANLAALAAALSDASLVVPVARTPTLAATAARAEDAGLPTVTGVTAVEWGRADLSSWWSWACTAA